MLHFVSQQKTFDQKYFVKWLDKSGLFRNNKLYVVNILSSEFPFQVNKTKELVLVPTKQSSARFAFNNNKAIYAQKNKMLPLQNAKYRHV